MSSFQGSSFSGFPSLSLTGGLFPSGFLRNRGFPSAGEMDTVIQSIRNLLSSVRKSFITAEEGTPLAVLSTSIQDGTFIQAALETSKPAEWTFQTWTEVIRTIVKYSRTAALQYLATNFKAEFIRVREKSNIADDAASNEGTTPQILDILYNDMGIIFGGSHANEAIKIKNLDSLRWIKEHNDEVKLTVSDADIVLAMGWLNGLQYICETANIEPSVDVVTLFRTINDSSNYDGITACIGWLLSVYRTRVTLEQLKSIKSDALRDAFKTLIPYDYFIVQQEKEKEKKSEEGEEKESMGNVDYPNCFCGQCNTKNNDDDLVD